MYSDLKSIYIYYDVIFDARSFNIDLRVSSSSFIASISACLSELSDVNVVNPQNGMVLVYNALTKKFDATLELTPGATQNLDINGGNF